MAPSRLALWTCLLLCFALSSVRGQQNADTTPTASSPAPSFITTTVQTFPTEGTLTSGTGAESTEPAVFVPAFQNPPEVSIAYTFDLSSPDIIAFCWYPISGQYGVLPRILFYVTILAALLLRHHQWLYAGALVSALTYSGAAAIHACLLIWRGPAEGDLDVVALLAVLSISCLVTVPLLNWSTTLRNIGKNENEIKASEDAAEKSDLRFEAVSRAIILYWGFLVMVGFLCVFIGFTNAVWTSNDVGRWWYPYTEGGTQIRCAPDGGQLNMTAGQTPFFGAFLITQDFVDANGCSNPCRSASPGSGGTALFRSDGNMVLPEQSQVMQLLDASGRVSRSTKFTVYYLVFGLFVLPYILLQGVWAAFFGRRTPAQARNVVYAILTRFRFNSSPLHPPSSGHQRAAKFFAILSYLWAVFVLVICIPIIITNMTALEIALYFLPDQENLNSVGQWGPWAATGVALCATFFARYHEKLKYLTLMSIYKTAWLAIHPSWPFRQLSSNSNDRDQARNIVTGELETMPDRYLFKNTTKKVVGGSSEKSISYVRDRVFWIPFAISGEWEQFWKFWRDPESSRANQGHLHRLAVTCGCPVQPPCSNDPRYFDIHRCIHKPECYHTGTCKQNFRLRALNPERVGVHMAFPLIHNRMLQLDVTGKPVPYSGKRNDTEDFSPYRKKNADYSTVQTHSDSEEETTKVPMPNWHQQRQRPPKQKRSSSSQDKLKRMFGVRRQSEPDSGNSARRGLISQVLQPQSPEMDNSSIVRRKSEGITVVEQPIHPALRRPSYVDSYHSREPSDGRHRKNPSIYSVHESQLLQRKPSTQAVPPRVPNSTPDQRSEISPLYESNPVSPLNPRSVAPKSGTVSRPHTSEGPSPASGPGSIPYSDNEIVSPQSDNSPPRPWREERPEETIPRPPPPLHTIAPSRANITALPPTHIAAQMRSVENLAGSVAQSISNRPRRSTTYSAAGTPVEAQFPIYMEPSPDHRSLGHHSNASQAPIPVFSEPDYTLLPATNPGATAPPPLSRNVTSDNIIISMQFTPGEHPGMPSTPASSKGPTPPPKNTPPPPSSVATAGYYPYGLRPQHRYTLPASLQVSTRPHIPLPDGLANRGASPLGFGPGPILLSPSSALSDSTVALPSISTPGVVSAARAKGLRRKPTPSQQQHQQQQPGPSSTAATAVAQNQPPNRGAPGPGPGATVINRAPLSAAGSRIQSLEGVREEEGAALLDDGGGGDGVLLPGARAAAMLSPSPSLMSSSSLSSRMRGSPRPPGYRSTVSYLQVQRPSTMLFADEITLRKDEFGVYRVVVNGEEVIE